MGSKYLCMDCFSIYDSDFIKTKTGCCPDASCDGEIAEIDELMLPTISILNMKGYLTKFCCSGHYYHYPRTYIMFYNGIRLPNLPKGFKAHTDSKYGNTIDFHYPKNLSSVDLFCAILDTAKVLVKWAMDLPEADDEDWFEEGEDFKFIADENVVEDSEDINFE